MSARERRADRKASKQQTEAPSAARITTEARDVPLEAHDEPTTQAQEPAAQAHAQEPTTQALSGRLRLSFEADTLTLARLQVAFIRRNGAAPQSIQDLLALSSEMVILGLDLDDRLRVKIEK